MQELKDYGFLTIEQLAESVSVPQHLMYARRAAITLNDVLEEQRNANTEKESSREETHQAETSRDVPAPDRLEHASGDRQPQIQTSAGIQNGEITEVDEEGGREHDSEGLIEPPPARRSSVKMVDNWKVTMEWQP
jgi:hypothetical protein